MRTPILLTTLALFTAATASPLGAAVPETAWGHFQAKWAEAWEGHEIPSTVTLQRLSIIDGKLVETPETLRTEELLLRIESIAADLPAPRQVPPTSFLMVGHLTPATSPVGIGITWLGFSVFACATISPMAGIVNVPTVNAPNLGMVQYAGVAGHGLRVVEQTGIALGDLQLFPTPAPLPAITAGAVDADVAVLHPESFSLCLTLFGIPIFSTTFLFLDGDLSR